MTFGIYLHIPFCRQKCCYCDFPSYAHLTALQGEYIAALREEIAAQGGLLAPEDTADTLYIGGGTPTVLPAAALTDLVAAAKRAFRLSPDAEVTIEANPGTVDIALLSVLYAAGVNRISFGVQSFQDRLLRALGRLHTAAAASAAVCMARQAGFANISVDLMYGLPGQTPAELIESVRQAIQLGVEHVSVYGLQVEAGTVFAERQARGELCLPDEDTENMMYEYITRTLPEQGYLRYEISNFAKRGYESRHNLKYWQNQPYLGLGAAAHSYREPWRSANTDDVAAYIANIKAGKCPAKVKEKLDRTARMEEFCFLGLRTAAGISPAVFAEKFHCDFFAVYGHTIEELLAKKMLAQASGRLFLTELGMKYGNQAFGAFLLK